ncbi:MAG TPA: rRNA maturation RNase YbeY [Acidimicrobiales bacterium]|nr:rRNA maturation RNase YbeY [Acidimicrobiales bacterium]
MSVEVFAADEQSVHPVDTLRLINLAEAVLKAEGVRGDAELSILFIDEQSMSDLNKRFAGKDGPTDVLSFPIDEEPVEGGRSPDSGGTGPGDMPNEPSDMPTLLGDIVICPAVAARNVADGIHDDRAATFDDELALLVVHGILHLMGMDHVDDEEAAAMEKRELALLAQFNAPGGAAPSSPAVPGPSQAPASPSAPSSAATPPQAPS